MPAALPCRPPTHSPAGHTRFATSSTPLPSEAHPHQWTPTAPTVVWRADSGGGIIPAREPLGIYITHNGAERLPSVCCCPRVARGCCRHLRAMLTLAPSRTLLASAPGTA